MSEWDLIAEGRILDAMARGEFDHLPGSGKPLALDDDALVPPDMRMACRILKNAGYVPEEVAWLGEAAALREEFPDAPGAERQLRALRRFEALRARLCRGREGHLAVEDFYYRKIVRCMAGDDARTDG